MRPPRRFAGDDRLVLAAKGQRRRVHLHSDRGLAARPAAHLGRLEADPAAVTPALLDALGHGDADVRRAAARALGGLGAAALPVLKAPLSDSDPEVRRAAVEALGWIGVEAVPDLTDALRNDAPEARRAAARALGRFGPAAKSAEAALIETVNDRNRDVREAAALVRQLS